MRFKTMAAAIFLAAALAASLEAQNYDTNNDVVQTFAGFGLPGCLDGQGIYTEFSAPSQIVSDTASNLYVLDSANFRIRKITPNGTVTTFAGGGNDFEGYGTNASLSWATPGPLAIDHANQLWLVMGGYSISYLVSIGTNGYVSINNGGLTNLTTASGLCVDSANRLYYSGGNRIYRYDSPSGTVSPFAGNGVAGNYDGQGTIFDAFSAPGALACDQADNLYVWDVGNGTIRRIDPQQNVTTIAGNGSFYSMADGVGTNASFAAVESMFADNSGNIYFACESCIRKMDAKTSVVTLAGTFNTYYGSGSFADGPGDLARFNGASGGCLSQGQIFVADSGNNRIRAIAFNPQPQTIAPPNLKLNTYPGVQITGVIGKTYQIQSSAGPTSWNTVATVLLTSSPYLWIDQNPVSGHKFYRALMLP